MLNYPISNKHLILFAVKFLYSKYSKQEVVRGVSPNWATIFKDGFHEFTKIKSTLYRLLLKIFSFSFCNYADQIKPLIQSTATGRLSTVACFKTLEFHERIT